MIVVLRYCRTLLGNERFQSCWLVVVFVNYHVSAQTFLDGSVRLGGEVVPLRLGHQHTPTRIFHVQTSYCFY